MQNPSIRRLWWWLLTGILAVGALALSLRDVDIYKSFAIAQRANLFLLALACIAISGSYAIRALRWQLILTNEYNMDWQIVFWATVIGYLGNSMLPARAGDVIRSIAVSHCAGISKSFAFTSVAIERIIELAGIALVSLLALSIIEEVPEWLNTATRLAVILASLGVAVLFSITHIVQHKRRLAETRVGKKIGKILCIIPLPPLYRNRVIQSFQHILQGFYTLQDTSQVVRIIAITVIIWLIETCFTILIAQALGIAFGVTTALLLLCALSLASIVPSTPGYIGIFQFVAVTLLTPLGFLPDAAIAYIVVFQLVQYLMVTLWGGFGLWRLTYSGLSLRRLREETAGIRNIDRLT